MASSPARAAATAGQSAAMPRTIAGRSAASTQRVIAAGLPLSSSSIVFVTSTIMDVDVAVRVERRRDTDRKSVVLGKSGSGSVDLGGRVVMNKTNRPTHSI